MARGTIRQRGPHTWQLRAYAGMDYTTGKERHLSVTVHAPTRREAETELAKLVARAARMRDSGATMKPPGHRVRSPRTVREGFEAWRVSARPDLEPNGADTDEDILNNYVYPHLGDVELWRLRSNQLAAPGDPDHDPDIVSLTAYYFMLKEKGSRGRRRVDGTIVGRGKPLGSQVIRRTHGVIRRALAYCMDRGWVSSNAAIGAKMPPLVRRTPSTPSPATLAAFVAFLEEDDPEILCFLDLMNSGARRVDMGLQWQEISFAADGGAVTFGARGLITARGPDGKAEVLVRTTPTRKRKLRTVALDAGPVSRLMALRTHQQARAALCGVELPDTAFVFSGAPDGSEPRFPSWFSGGFRRARARAGRAGINGLTGVRAYDVRHFMCTQLLAHGVAPAVVAERAGNSERTMDAFYRHAVPAQDQAAAELMARIMRDAANGTSPLNPR